MFLSFFFLISFFFTCNILKFLVHGQTSSILVHDRNFMQALTRPNTIAILETNTSFGEDHKIVFDVLEFTEGERLYGCCYNTKVDADGSFIAFNLIEYQFYSIRYIP